MEPVPSLPTLPLDPRYKPAKSDLFIQIRFIGNTPSISDITLGRVTTGHLDAAIAALADARKEMHELAKADAERRRIVTTGQLPPDGFLGIDALRSP